MPLSDGWNRKEPTRRRRARAKAGKAAKRAKPKSGTDEFYTERVTFLEGRVRKLETENDRLKRQFVRWQRNAFAAGMTMQQLDRPALRMDRGQADE
jgi:predicted RNase H-like nuclease (RuvC/YqgF family)